MRFVFVLVVALSAAAVAVPASSRAHEFVIWIHGSEKVIAANRALDKGNVAKALRLTREALESPLTFNDMFNAYNILCIAYTDLTVFDVAVEYCDRALALRNDWRVLNNRGNARLGLGKIDEAIGDYESALAIEPDAEVLKGNLALALKRKRLGVPAIDPARTGA